MKRNAESSTETSVAVIGETANVMTREEANKMLAEQYKLLHKHSVDLGYYNSGELAGLTQAMLAIHSALFFDAHYFGDGICCGKVDNGQTEED